MIVIFSRNKHPISKLIRVRTGFKYSHTAMLDTNGVQLIEAKGGEHGGVVRTPIHKFLERYDNYEARWVRGDVSRCYHLIGKAGFDTKGAWGNCLRLAKTMQSPEDWFCTELTGLCMDDSNKDTLWAFTPYIIYMMSQSVPQHLRRSVPAILLRD